MASISFTFVYQIRNGVIANGSSVDARVVESVDDGVLDFDTQEPFRIVNPNFTVNGTYLGTTAVGEVCYLPTGYTGTDIEFILLTNTAYPIGAPKPVLIATDLAICFASKTRIRTAHGLVAVEDLDEGSLVPTRDHGLQPVRWTGKRHIPAAALRLRPALQPIRIAAGTLGNTRALTVSPEHRMLVTGWRAEVLHGTAEVLVPAKALVNDSTIRRMIPEDGVEYWHVLFDQHEVIEAEGCWSESLNPDAHALDGMDADARDEVLALFPELANGAGLPAARTVQAEPLCIVTC